MLSSRVQDRIDPVIRLWLMTADNAGAADIGFGLADRYPPAAETRDFS